MSGVEVWGAYYTHAGLTRGDVRPGCEPRLIRSDRNNHAVVLVHGLTDSPFFMEAIGQYFHNEMGFNVFMPLLTGHGLKQPTGMKNVTWQQWVADVDFALGQAQALADDVAISIGGLSTGGTLSVYKALLEPENITGDVFLFSAALDLAGKTGELQEFLLGLQSLVNLFSKKEDRKTPLIGLNPYRYARIDLDGAEQLAELIRILDREIQRKTLQKPVFVAHSEADSTAGIDGVERLIEKSQTSDFFRIGQAFGVPHASMVLKENVLAQNGSPLEPKNPFFQQMMAAAHQFAKQTLKDVL